MRTAPLPQSNDPKSPLPASTIFLSTGLFFFFLMIVIPTTYQIWRGCLLGLLCLGALIGTSHASAQWRLDKQIVMILLLTTVASLLFMLNGVIQGAAGALRVGTVYVLWPLLYVFFTGFFRRPEIVVKFEKVILWGIIVSALMGLLFVAESLFGQNGRIKEILAFQGAAIGIYGGYIEYRLFNMTTLIYGFPFLVTLFLVRDKTNRSDFGKYVLITALILVLLAAAVSGRRAFFLVIMLSPFIIGPLLLVSRQYLPLKRLMELILPVILVILGIYSTAVIDFSGIAEKIASARQEFSSGVRFEQFHTLMGQWSEKPLLGYGAGAGSEKMIRSEEMTWTYELSYISLLFQTGIVGVCVYTVAVGWVFTAGIKIVRNRPQAASVILPLLSALAGFLIVNATNPYLWKFDYLWTLFLPVAAINAYRTRAPNSISSS